MRTPSKYHKAAVDSGQWLLYRHDPRRAQRNMNALQLDAPAPKLGLKDYLSMEGRFAKLFAEGDSDSENKLIAMQEMVEKRYDKYLSLANRETPNRMKSVKDKR
jgi:pyruvate-ferredoxin/flavodoxin oxidoreductase